LRDVPTYQTGAAIAVPIEPDEGEDVLGVYEWPRGTPALMVTTLGLRTPPHWELLLYTSILDIGGPASKTEARPALTLSLADGGVRTVVIGGTHGQFQDVWAFVRFLIRVLDDAKAQ